MSSVSLPLYGDLPLERELQLQRLLRMYIATGLLFMLLPGTFLGVWNLVSISSEHSLSSLSPAWLQAHGHAQIFGWIGTFVIGIGYYSLSKMGTVLPFAVSRGWLSWCLWTVGLILRWIANVTLWQWRTLLPMSAGLELAAFLIFFLTVSRHKRGGERRSMEVWMKLVVASTAGFLLLLVLNASGAVFQALRAEGPGFAHWFDQRFLVLATWGFPVLAVWGFNGRWLPIFLGLKQSSNRGLLAALAICTAGVISALCGYFRLAAGLLLIASAVSIAALNVFERAERPAKIAGVHPSFPVFVRVCYAWLVVAAALSMSAATSDRNGGIWGASRHALTVGFLASMIFTIGPRILPAFCGARRLFSPLLMFASLALLNLGCLLRVASEIPAYEGFAQAAWRLLPVSAILELIAVSIFAANLAFTLVFSPSAVQGGHARERAEHSKPLGRRRQ
jgi:hypothetical protein